MADSSGNTESDSVDETRLASLALLHTGQADQTRIARSPAAESEATRIARSARLADLETEGTRIRCIHTVRAAPATDHEVIERYQIGDKIDGRYEVLAIHRGTMGVVYGTFDHEERLPRALKTLQQRYVSDKGMQDLFAAEAMTWVKLEKHPFIVRAYLVEKFDNQPYVITEYIRGQENMGGDLRAWLGHPNLTLPLAVEMALQIAQGMQHACRRIPGLVHRDLKPANVLVDERARAMVTDFGLVEAEDTGAGTPAYMAPEQWRLEPLDTRTDIYAYGCILYEVFTGHRMYAASSEGEWEAAHLTQAPADPITIKPDLPPRITGFIGRCLAKQQARRPADWDEVVLECATWFHQITGQPVVFDFSADVLSTDELLTASYSLDVLGKYAEMLEVCDRALAIDPNDAELWNNKGNALNRLNRREEAVSAYNRALAIDPKHARVLINMGTTLNSLKRYEEAISAYDRALAIDVVNGASAWYNKGNALRSLNRQEEAISAYDRALAIEPNRLNAMINRGNVLNSLKRHEEAISAYDQALAIDGYAPAWHYKAYALNDLKRYEEAISAYDQALVFDPNNVDIWFNKGGALNNLKRYEEAVSAYDRVLTIDPNDSFALNNKKEVLLKLRRRTEALAKNDRILKEALALSAQTRKESLTAPTSTLAIDQDLRGTWFNKGNELGAIQRHVEALAAYDHALAIDPNYADAWYNKGNVLDCLNRHEEAIAAYDRALVIDPNYMSARDGRSVAIERLKDRRSIWPRFLGKLFGN